MKAAYIERYRRGGPIVIGSRPDPTAGPGQLLVRVRAASVNPIDFKIRDGALRSLFRFPMPLVLGSDLAGEVVAIGAGVTGFSPGQAIMARVDKRHLGAYAELAAIDATHAAPKPQALSFAEAASLPLAGLTAWQALHDVGKLAAGQKVLILAGSGGVGTLALQLARVAGAHVATTASPRNHDLCRSLGADEVIDYRQQRFEELLHDYDLVLDSIGGPAQLAAFRVLRPGGVVVTIAGLPSSAFARSFGLPWYLRAALSWKERPTLAAARAAGARWEYLFMRPDGAQLSELGKLVERGRLRPVIDRIFPLAETEAALAYVATGRAVGKVVIEIE